MPDAGANHGNKRPQEPPYLAHSCASHIPSYSSKVTCCRQTISGPDIEDPVPYSFGLLPSTFLASLLLDGLSVLLLSKGEGKEVLLISPSVSSPSTPIKERISSPRSPPKLELKAPQSLLPRFNSPLLPLPKFEDSARLPPPPTFTPLLPLPKVEEESPPLLPHFGQLAVPIVPSQPESTHPERLSGLERCYTPTPVKPEFVEYQSEIRIYQHEPAEFKAEIAVKEDEDIILPDILTRPRMALGGISDNQQLASPSISESNPATQKGKLGKFSLRKAAGPEGIKKYDKIRESGRGLGKREKVRQCLESYGQYRSKARKMDKWPDEAEEAFMEAIEMIPPQGRSKQYINGKHYGRNELIGMYIFRKTGIWRCRKQISSHVQVLKTKLKHVPNFMTAVSNKPDNAILDLVEGAEEYRQMEREEMMTPDASTPSTYNSQSPGAYNIQEDSPNYMDMRVDPSVLSPPPSHPSTPCPLPEPALSFSPSIFKMTMGPPNSTGGVDEFHTYTVLPTHSSQDLALGLPSLPSWRQRFPHLASILTTDPSSLSETNILHLSARISLSTASMPENSSLCTQWELAVSDAASFASFNTHSTWEATTRIFSGSHEDIPMRLVWHQSRPLDLAPDSNLTTSSHHLALPFGSDFWGHYFVRLADRQAEKALEMAADGISATKAHRVADKMDRDALEGLTMIQEVFETTAGLLGVEKTRRALLLWEFTVAPNANQPEVDWRAVVPDQQIASADLFGQGILAESAQQLLTPTPVESEWGARAFEQQPQTPAFQADEQHREPRTFEDVQTMEALGLGPLPEEMGYGQGVDCGATFTTGMDMAFPILAGAEAIDLGSQDVSSQEMEQYLAYVGGMDVGVGDIGDVTEGFDGVL